MTAGVPCGDVTAHEARACASTSTRAPCARAHTRMPEIRGPRARKRAHTGTRARLRAHTIPRGRVWHRRGRTSVEARRNTCGQPLIMHSWNSALVARLRARTRAHTHTHAGREGGREREGGGVRAPAITASAARRRISGEGHWDRGTGLPPLLTEGQGSGCRSDWRGARQSRREARNGRRQWRAAPASGRGPRPAACGDTRVSEQRSQERRGADATSASRIGGRATAARPGRGTCWF